MDKTLPPGADVLPICPKGSRVMPFEETRPVSGQVFRARRPQRPGRWYAKYRLPMTGRFSGGSGRRGQPAGAGWPVFSPSATRRTGCAMCSTGRATAAHPRALRRPAPNSRVAQAQLGPREPADHPVEKRDAAEPARGGAWGVRADRVHQLLAATAPTPPSAPSSPGSSTRARRSTRCGVIS